MSNEMKEKYKISPYFIVFPLYVGMVKTGILSFQRQLIEHAGYNAWISVALTGISIHIILFVMFKLLSSAHGGQDISAINTKLFGRVLGSLLNVAVVVYFVYGAFVSYKVYIELIQVWFFPEMNILPLSVCFALIIYYVIVGGFRSITGLGAWSMLITVVSVIPQLLLTFPYLHPRNLLPLVNHSVSDILLSSKSMVFEYMGFEALLLFYPFIKSPEKSQKWAHLLVMLVTFMYMAILITAFMFYSEGQLRQSNWPTLGMISILEIPLLQRLEYFFVSLWLIKFIAGIALYLWAASRGMKTALRISQRHSLVVFLLAIVTLNYFISEHESIKWITRMYGTIGFYFIYAYIPFLFVCVIIRKRLLHHQDENKQA